MAVVPLYLKIMIEPVVIDGAQVTIIVRSNFQHEKTQLLAIRSGCSSTWLYPQIQNWRRSERSDGMVPYPLEPCYLK